MVSGHSQISRREKCDRIQVKDSNHRWQVGDWMSWAQCLGVSWGIQSAGEPERPDWTGVSEEW